MSLIKLQQTQMSGSLSFDDDLNVRGSDYLQKTTRSLVDDLNALRTQIRVIQGTEYWTSELAGSQSLSEIEAAMKVDGTTVDFEGDVYIAEDAFVSGSLEVAEIVTALGGFSGSLTRLSGGGDYLLAGKNISTVTGALGDIEIIANPGDVANGVQYNVDGYFTANANFTFDGSKAYLTGTLANGNNAIALGNYSHAEGAGSKAISDNSHAEGGGTVAGRYELGFEFVGDNIAYFYTSNDLTAEFNASPNFKILSNGELKNISVLSATYDSENSQMVLELENDYGLSGGFDAYSRETLWYDAWITGNFSIVSMGEGSHTEGYLTWAPGPWSHAEGAGTIAFGDAAHAEGNGTTTFGNFSHAEGWDTVASGVAAHAEGYEVIAVGQYAHAEGEYTVAQGQASHAEGYYSTGSADYAHAEGRWSLASGIGAHAEGDLTTAGGQASHAEGSGSLAMGLAAHAEGYLSSAPADYSHAEGWVTIASGSWSHAEGKATITSGSWSHSEGVFTVARGEASHAEGSGSLATGIGSHAEGKDTTALGNFSHAGGVGTLASGYGSIAMGFGAVAAGNFSVAMGDNTVSSGSYQTVFGRWNKENNSDSVFIIGGGTDDENRRDLMLVGQETIMMGSASLADDTFFFVSGSIGAKAAGQMGVSLFGGDTFVSGTLYAEQGISGSLTKLADGTSYMIAGVGIQIVSASNGAVTISANSNSTVKGYFAGTDANLSGNVFTFGPGGAGLGTLSTATDEFIDVYLNGVFLTYGAGKDIVDIQSTSFELNSGIAGSLNSTDIISVVLRNVS